MNLKRLLVASSLIIASNAFAVSFDLEADLLQTSTPGAAMSQSGLIMLVADTDGNGFGQAVATSIGSGTGDRTSDGLFLDGVGGDDLILFGSNLTDSGTDGVLAVFPSLTLGTYGGKSWDQGDSLALVWFPGLTTSSSMTAANDSYGLFTSLTPDAGSVWSTPANNVGSYQLYIFTTNSAVLPAGAGTGTSSPSDLVAGLTVVPEPSTYALIAALGCLGVIILRRRK